MLREPFAFHPFSFFQSRSSSSRSSFIPFRLRLNLVVLLAVVVMVILEEEVLIGAVSSKSDGGPTQTGEKALEAVPSSEGTGVSPSLVSSPWVFLCPDGVGRGSSLELLHIEAGGVAVDHCGRYVPCNGGLKVNWKGEGCR